ncbi:uncharacterized protein I206_107159 [Kwoniella pini CBS 10737]|uniref:MIT domain-containing protein n=1 Tax=Kwoniella pini CBS 10737 TaxID=1296096 RepID=A0A1B9HZ02_9TREE|nr:uncharacterized protein I206_05296 [Kwoniella pini CBS 10737]OCF48517.1 hypothetical protein I206_05296 [Kwoniella pini CBS 10737]
MEGMISRSESGLEPDNLGGFSELKIRTMSISTSDIPSTSSSSLNPSTPTNPIPPNSEDTYLDVSTNWGGEHDTRNNAIRSSRMIGNRIGVSPPPPPGPPPSDPPPLPPISSSHPFAASSRPKPSARLSSLSSLRKSNLMPSRPSSPAGPPPTSDLPPIPFSSSATPPRESIPMSSGSSSSTSAENRPNHIRQLSQNGNAPTVSPRSSSLFQKNSQSNHAGPSSSTIGESLGTPITLSKKLPETSQNIAVAGPSHSSKPPRTPSRHLLQTALDLAQKAVEMDKNNDVLGALAAYREAVSRLKAVMERVGVESSGEKKSGRKGKSEEEGRTLRGIHDAYVARIQLLSSYEAPQSENDPSPEAGPSTHRFSLKQSSESSHPSTSTATLVPPSQASAGETPRPSLDDGGMADIGNLMLSEASASATVSPARPKPSSSNISSGNQPFPSSFLVNPSPPNFNGVTSVQAPSDVATTHQRGSIPSIGLGYPTSPPTMTHPSSSSATPMKSHVSSNSIGGESAGSPSSTRSRLKRPHRPSMGLDMEADLSGIDGIQEQDEEVEMLARTPREGQTRIPSGKIPDSPQSVRSIDRPLPPLPGSASLDHNGQLIITARTASLSGASKPLPSPSTLLVSPTTTQGTISQRRQSQPLSGTLTTVVDQQLSQQQPIASSSAFPISSSGSSIRSISQSSGNRVRAKSQPGQRPIIDQGQTTGSSVPPVPQNQLKHKSSFSSSSQLGTGISPQISRQSVAIQSNGLRIETNNGYEQSQSLAPPAHISNSYRSGIGISPRSLPPLPDTAITSTSFGGGGGGSLMSPVPENQPSESLHRPFHLLRILYNSMNPEIGGSYLTGSIHISSSIWNNQNLKSFSSSGNKNLIPPLKIIAQEIKIKVLEGLILNFENIRITGQILLSNNQSSIKNPKRTTSSINNTSTINGGAEDFCLSLDEFDEEMDNIHKILSKNGIGVGSWKGKKQGGTTKSWGSRISRSMDKMTSNNRNTNEKGNLEGIEKYVELLGNFCIGSQIINDHLLNFTSDECNLKYSNLSENLFKKIESRLKRISEFLSFIIIPFILEDFKQFLLRYLKSGLKYLED